MTQTAHNDVMNEFTTSGSYAFADTMELCIWIFVIEDRIHHLAGIRDGLRVVSGDILSILEDDSSEPLMDAADIVDWTCGSLMAERDGMMAELADRRGFVPDVSAEEVSEAGGLAEWMAAADTVTLRRALAGFLGIL